MMPRAIIDWTDENTETLKRLWAEGHSASAVAKKLGNPEARSAVLGKVFRLGLSGRGESKRSKRAARVPKNGPAKRWDAEKEARFIKLWNDGTPAQHIADMREFGTEPNIHYHARRLNLPKRMKGRLSADKTPQKSSAAKPAAPTPVRRTDVPQSMTFPMVCGIPAAVVDLHSGSDRCQFPMGEVSDPDFHYCTNPAEPEQHYCEGHMRAMRTAYVPERRPKRSAIDFARYE